MNDDEQKYKILQIEQVIGQQVNLFTSNGFHYEGKIIDTGSLFLTFEDYTGRMMIINLQTIDRIQVGSSKNPRQKNTEMKK